MGLGECGVVKNVGLSEGWDWVYVQNENGLGGCVVVGYRWHGVEWELEVVQLCVIDGRV